jgi:hypothetical protein
MWWMLKELRSKQDITNRALDDVVKAAAADTSSTEIAHLKERFKEERDERRSEDRDVHARLTLLEQDLKEVRALAQTRSSK